MSMEVTTGQIIAFYIIMVIVSFSGIISIITFKDKGGDWEDKK